MHTLTFLILAGRDHSGSEGLTRVKGKAAFGEPKRSGLAMKSEYLNQAMKGREYLFRIPCQRPQAQKSFGEKAQNALWDLKGQCDKGANRHRYPPG